MNAALQILLTALGTGFASAIGNYIALKYMVDHLDRIPTVKDKIKESIARRNQTTNATPKQNNINKEA